MDVEQPIRLPPMQVSDIDETKLRALVDDILALGTQVEVSTKGAPLSHSHAQPTDLVSSMHRLIMGDVLGLQIRYTHEGARWCDTLMRLPEGFRLVRIKEDDVLASVEEEP
ncbi:MAG: hypothetical protein U0165_16260 [Polyangiaceae bacterium]